MPSSGMMNTAILANAHQAVQKLLQNLQNHSKCWQKTGVQMKRDGHC
jgi:hypothetical protein